MERIEARDAEEVSCGLTVIEGFSYYRNPYMELYSLILQCFILQFILGKRGQFDCELPSFPR